MERNGDHMAVDPVSPTANPKEKELFEQQPTAPRRNSIEDQDSSRPRKRLATMGSTTPQSNSPHTDKEDSMDNCSPRSATLTPSSTTVVTTPAASVMVGDLSMDQSPDTPLQTITTDGLAEEEISASPSATPSTTTLNVSLTRPAAPPAEVECHGTEEEEEGETVTAESAEAVSEPEKEVSLSPSEVTSGSQSPWQDGSYLRSPEVEVEELEGMEEDEVLAESVTVVGQDSDLLADQKDAFSQFAREFSQSINPRNGLMKLELFLSRFFEHYPTEQEQLEGLLTSFELWQMLPDVIVHLLRRREPLAPEFVLGRAQEGRHLIARLLITCFRITARFTELEAKNIQETPQNVDYVTICNSYLALVADILGGHDEIFTYLHKEYSISLAADIAGGLPAFLDDWNGLQAIKGYLQGIFKHIPEKPRILTFTFNPLVLLQELLRFIFHREWTLIEDQERIQTCIALVCGGAVEIVQMVQESQVQAINLKDYSWLIEVLGAIVALLNIYTPEYGLRLLPQQSADTLRSLTPHDRGEYSPALFKLPLLTNMIRCNRMDFRLTGITKLSECLLKLWKNLGGESNPSPALRSMADDLRRSGIIEYLVGPESHPELIRSSYNIGSFLVVNNCLTPDIRKAIWQPLIDNKDPRVVQALVKTVMEYVNHMQYHSMVDFCKRAIDIPFSSYDTVMLDFVSHLLNNTSRRFAEECRIDDMEKYPRLDPAPYWLIIDLIRKASIAEEQGVTCKGVSPSTISELMAHELVNITHYGPPADVRKKFYLQCVKDIREQNPSATGSIIVLWALLQRRPRAAGEESPEIDALTGELRCIDALIEDVASFVESHRSRDPGLRSRRLKARLDLLYWILLRAPNCMEPAQMDRLCDFLIGDKSLGYQERDAAFNTFASLHLPNPFIDYLFRHVYPNLNPLHISLHCLEACKRWVEYQNKGVPEISSANVVIVQGVEQIWRVIIGVSDRNLALEASSFLIKIYLESMPVINNPPEIIYSTHCSLVERCIEQLTSCASALKVLDSSSVEAEQSMAVDIPEAEVKERQREFDRAKPRFAPEAHTINGHSENKQVLGTRVAITVRWYSQGFQGPIHQLQMGSLDTAEELHKQISHIIGAGEYRAILNGRELYLQEDPSKTLGELGFSAISQLMVQKRPTEREQQGLPNAKQTLNIVETEILKHFDELYEMLNSQQAQGAMIWDLLRQFPPQPKAQSILLSDDIPPDDILPPGAPYRSLYLLNAMRVWLDENSQSDNKDTFVTRMVTSLVAFLIKYDMSAIASIELRFSVLNEAINILHKILQTSLPSEAQTLEVCFEREAEFVLRLTNIWEACLQPQYTQTEVSAQLAANAFIIVLEAARFRGGIWTVFTASKHCVEAIERMLLQDSRNVVRRTVGQTMVNSCNSQGPGNLQSVDVAEFFWSVLVKILPSGYRYQEQVPELFEVAKCILEFLGTYSQPDILLLNRYFVEWTSVLMAHQVKQIIGRPSEDFIILGYTQLLTTCIHLLGKDLSCADLKSRVVGIFRNLLFTPLSEPKEEDTMLVERLPCLGVQTREKLYNLLLTLADDETINETIVGLLSELVGQGEASFLPESNWNFDRSQLPISPAGRVGLRNLSNTCYLNSLLTQLFMNVPFRSFILNMTIDDPDDSQNLLHALKVLFARMQNGLMKTADTRELAQAIRDYDNNEIDVTVQMDVDEFFNLLFDRIEGQMETVDQKNAFRSYYGGKLVQQVKSKECPHISEREEPFSAIQCDIKGKLNLQESLKAYVEGEIMEGDNKYSCTSCNKHVDAVKRACLKEIPDHLIFHLKRFEFDLQTMFPECIDMRPYTIQYLNDSNPCATPDVFQLAGVLVHNGTAESGHYYSYIKDRHEFTEQNNPIWFEFNDSEVSPFEPSTIATSCYGGTDFIGPNKELGQPIAFHKTYSAYMLFYERVNPSHADSCKKDFAKRIPIPRDLGIEILQENERTIQKYCLFDGSYLLFTSSILRQAHALRVAKGTPETELVEKQALKLALRTYEQIGARIKESREADELFDTIKRLATSQASIECARGFLTWICQHQDSLRLLLLRCFHQRIREGFVNLILGALNQIRRSGNDYLVIHEDVSEKDISGYLPDVLLAVLRLWECLNNLFKPWDEYFSLLSGIANFGQPEKELLLRHGMLRRCFGLFMPEYLDRDTKNFHANVIKMTEKNPKRISYRSLLELMESLMAIIHISLEPCRGEGSREEVPGIHKFPLTEYERHILFHAITKDKERVNAFIFKQVSFNCHIVCTQRWIRYILASDQEPLSIAELIYPMKAALMHGIILDPANEAGPYLNALVAYCIYCPSPPEVKEIITRVADEVGTIHMNGGREHLDFFRSLWYNKSQRLAQTFLSSRVINTVPSWAPALLCYWETPIRLETEQLLKDRLFQNRADAPEGRRRSIEIAIERLPEACFRFAEEKFLKSKELCAAADEKTFDSLIRILKLCRRNGMEEDQGYMERIEADVYNAIVPTENWAASDVGSDSNHELGDDDSV
ncbi:hypothetical protein BDZ91DRAFT_747404 [Kalaharituber pfeilii]|nr:hypothetical protein BDZ91DRAFT_747404 [Kalaharituber pfeilii]